MLNWIVYSYSNIYSILFYLPSVGLNLNATSIGIDIQERDRDKVSPYLIYEALPI